jgi:hypothetical protein
MKNLRDSQLYRNNSTRSASVMREKINLSVELDDLDNAMEGINAGFYKMELESLQSADDVVLGRASD